MSIHRRNHKFHVRWREGSRNRSRSFDRRKDAQAFETHVRHQTQLGEAVASRTGGKTLDEFFARWIVGRTDLAPRTRKTYLHLYEARVTRHLGYLPVSRITTERLDDWRAQRLAAGGGPESVRKTSKLLHQVFRRAVKHGLLRQNPADFDREPMNRTEVIAATPEQVEQRLADDRRRPPADRGGLLPGPLPRNLGHGLPAPSRADERPTRAKRGGAHRAGTGTANILRTSECRSPRNFA